MLRLVSHGSAEAPTPSQQCYGECRLGASDVGTRIS